jgi:DNA-binding NtrC family response regulator
MKMLLSDCGHVVDEAVDVSAGMSLIVQRRYDVVLTEIDFFEGTGFDVLRSLEKTTSRAIVVTASLSVDTRELSHRLGVYDYFEKPCEPDCLLRAVQDAATALKPQKCLQLGWASVA